MPRKNNPVIVRQAPVVLPTYLPHPSDPNPMFLEKRVYQGSSGRVYPLPFCDRIEDQPVQRAWEAIHLENEFIYVMILPELGGRIHILRDKTNGYDAIYNQPVIKPALVGLAGPWASGGIEFNWPQHHRPATYMPMESAIERSPDGAVTVWLSDHDPMARMKGMHGVRLRPGRSVMELRVRAYNRTDDVQTFLWWANVATRVHERYESFFPPDATHVADHARRATSTFPRCSGRYYGVDYAKRARHGIPPEEQPANYRSDGSSAADNLAWYTNIPVPTSYMCMGSRSDFLGGYDHAAKAGLVHVANHHIAPGKKQWTWGNHEFGYAWDRNLTDARPDGEYPPYIELMAGVYTDNQPDFSFLQPGETKAWTQCWYPIRDVGPVQEANADAAVHLSAGRRSVRVGVAVTARHAACKIILSAGGRVVFRWARELAPDKSFVTMVRLPAGKKLTDLTLRVTTSDGRELIRHTPKLPSETTVPPPATEPLPPEEMTSSDELFITGLHLEQYRHATRMPESYWGEALRRDPGDSRCNLALGRWHLRRGEFEDAERHLRAAIARLTSRNPNPADGETHYQLGRCLRHLRREDDAYDAFYKATWNQGWAAASFLALAEIDSRNARWPQAREHLERCLRLDADNLRARALLASVLRRLGEEIQAAKLLKESLRLDPLDAWTRHLVGQPSKADNQTRLDVAHDMARAGLFEDAIGVLGDAAAEPTTGAMPLVHYTLGWLLELAGQNDEARRARQRAHAASVEYCFPARLEEIAVLGSAIAAEPNDARAHYLIGNLLYDRRRHREAIGHWQRAAKLEPSFPTVWRNLGIGFFNVLKQPRRAAAAYARAVRVGPDDARLLFERDQLWKRLGESPRKRLAHLERRRDLVVKRDDLTIEYCRLLNQTGRHSEAGQILSSRRFQPWEGGEGQALGQFVRTHLALGKLALAEGRPQEARDLLVHALKAPSNLGEAKHLLANQSDIHLLLGDALTALNERASARAHWRRAADFEGDFQQMSVRPYSEMTYYSALALRRLGRRHQGESLLRALLRHARSLRSSIAIVDYFATSLPTMLLFDDDLQARQNTEARFLEAQARLGLGETARARRILRGILQRDPNHEAAADLVRTVTDLPPARTPES